MRAKFDENRTKTVGVVVIWNSLMVSRHQSSTTELKRWLDINNK